MRLRASLAYQDRGSCNSFNCNYSSRARSPVNSNWSDFLAKAVFKRKEHPLARGWRGAPERKARPFHVRSLPPEPSFGRGQPGAVERVSGALRARYSGMAGVGDARLPKPGLKRAIHLAL